MERTPSRRDVLRAGGSMAALSAVGLSGCQGRADPGLGSDDGTSRLDLVPGGATAVARVDVAGLLGDQQLRDNLDDFARDAAGGSGRAANVSQILDETTDRVGLDPREVSELVAFADAASGSYAGAVLWTDWSESTVTERLGDDRQERTYADTTVYDVGESSVATLGDGQYVAGTTAAVEDALDVRAGDASTVGGEVRTAYEAARSGYVRFGFDVPSELTAAASGSDDAAATVARNVAYGYGSVFSVDSDAGVTFTVAAGDEEGAETIEGQLDDWLTAAREDLGEGSDRPQSIQERLGTLLEGTDVTRDGSTVTVRNEDSGGELVALAIAVFFGGFAIGTGESRGGSGRPVTPQAMFGFEYDADAGKLRVTHEGGDHIAARRLVIRGDGLDRTGSWRDLGGDASGTVDGKPAVAAGDRVALGAAPDYEALVVWEAEDRSVSTTLAQDVGPGN